MDNGNKLVKGLTKREYFAGLIMQCIIARDGSLHSAGSAKDAVKHAEALIAELEKAPE